jgi:hypothetical protein
MSATTKAHGKQELTGPGKRRAKEKGPEPCPGLLELDEGDRAKP